METKPGTTRTRNTAFRCVVAALVVVLLLAGCHLLPGTKKSTGTTNATISGSGGQLSHAGLTLTYPANTAPDGTKVTIEDTDAGIATHPGMQTREVELVEYTQATFKVTIGDNEQPQAGPLKLSAKVGDRPDDKAIPAVLVRSAVGSISPVVGTYDASAKTITASIPHLSWFHFVWLNTGKLVDFMQKTLSNFWGLSATKPDCAQQQNTKNDVPVVKHTQGSKTLAWICPNGNKDSASVTLYNATAMPLEIRADHSPSVQPSVGAGLSNSVLLATSFQMQQRNPKIKGYILGTESSTVEWPQGDLPARVGVILAPEMSLLQILVEVLLAILPDNIILTVAAGVECVSKLLDTYDMKITDGPEELGKITAAMANCVGAFASDMGAQGGVVGVFVAIIATAPTLFIGNIQGAWRTITGEDKAEWRVTKPAKPFANTKIVVAGLHAVKDHEGNIMPVLSSAAAQSWLVERLGAPTEKTNIACYNGNPILQGGSTWWWKGFGVSFFDQAEEIDGKNLPPGHVRSLYLHKKGNSKVSGPKGLGLGSDFDKVTKAYPTVLVKESALDDGLYLDVPAVGGGTLSFSFDTRGSTQEVFDIHAGARCPE